MTTGHPVVDRITKLRLWGNVIPAQWFGRILAPNGQTDLVAIVILSELCSWYRANITKDEATGNVTSCTKRFATDMFRRSTRAWSKLLGVSEDRAWNGIETLRKAGLIRTERRPMELEDGTKTQPVLHLEPNPTAIEALTYASPASEKDGCASANDSRAGAIVPRAEAACPNSPPEVPPTKNTCAKDAQVGKAKPPKPKSGVSRADISACSDAYLAAFRRVRDVDYAPDEAKDRTSVTNRLKSLGYLVDGPAAVKRVMDALDVAERKHKVAAQMVTPDQFMLWPDSLALFCSGSRFNTYTESALALLKTRLAGQQEARQNFNRQRGEPEQSQSRVIRSIRYD